MREETCRSGSVAVALRCLAPRVSEVCTRKNRGDSEENSDHGDLLNSTELAKVVIMVVPKFFRARWFGSKRSPGYSSGVSCCLSACASTVRSRSVARLTFRLPRIPKTSTFRVSNAQL